MPIITIWVGVFPMQVNFWMALGSTIYISANCSIIYYFKRPQCPPTLFPTARRVLVGSLSAGVGASAVFLSVILKYCSLQIGCSTQYQRTDNLPLPRAAKPVPWAAHPAIPAEDDRR